MKITGLACSVACVVGTAALSADPLPAEIMLARRLFAEARAGEEAKDWVTAAAKLREAIDIKETAGLRFHLAYCEEQQGLLVEALVDYERSEDLPAQNNETFRSQLPAKKDVLHRRIPTLMIVVPTEVADASLKVDGHVLPATYLGKPVPLDPGRHTAAVSAPERVTFTMDLTLNEGDAVVTNAAMLTAAPKPSVSPLAGPAVMPQREPRVPSSSARTIVVIGEAAVTLGAVAVGIGYTLAASSSDDQASSDHSQVGDYGCASPLPALVATCADLQTQISNAQSDRFIARLGFIGAGVGAAAFASTLLLWPASRPRVTVVPLLDRKSAGLSAELEF